MGGGRAKPVSRRAARQKAREEARASQLVEMMESWEQEVGLPHERVKLQKSAPQLGQQGFRSASAVPERKDPLAEQFSEHRLRMSRPESAAVGMHGRRRGVLIEGGRPRTAGPARSAVSMMMGQRTEDEKQESRLPPNGAQQAQERVERRLDNLRHSGKELQELERRVVRYRRGLGAAGAVYKPTLNKQPAQLRRTRPHTALALYVRQNEEYTQERERVVQRRAAAREAEMAEHIANRDRHELKRQAERQARAFARRIQQEKTALVACALASRTRVAAARVEKMRLGRLMESGRDRAVRKMQEAVRRWYQQKHGNKLYNAAHKIQRVWRWFAWRRLVERRQLAASKIISYLELAGGSGGFVQVLKLFRHQVIVIQRWWRTLLPRGKATEVVLARHWDVVREAAGAEKELLTEAVSTLKKTSKLPPEMKAATGLFPEPEPDKPAAKKPDGEKPKKKTMKEKRADELAAKHATLTVLEKRLAVLPNFAKEVPKKTKMVTLRVWLQKRQAIFRQDFRDYCARLVVYDEEMVGVNKKLETRRAIGANTAIEMPDKPERPRRKLFPPDEEMWAVILDGEARTKGRGRK